MFRSEEIEKPKLILEQCVDYDEEIETVLRNLYLNVTNNVYGNSLASSLYYLEDIINGECESIDNDLLKTLEEIIENNAIYSKNNDKLERELKVLFEEKYSNLDEEGLNNLAKVFNNLLNKEYYLFLQVATDVIIMNKEEYSKALLKEKFKLYMARYNMLSKLENYAFSYLTIYTNGKSEKINTMFQMDFSYFNKAYYSSYSKRLDVTSEIIEERMLEMQEIANKKEKNFFKKFDI